MNPTLRMAVLVVAVAAGTHFIGWSAVPIVAAIAAVVRRRPELPGQMALAAALAWGGLLGWRATSPAFTTLLDRLGGVFPAPGWVLAIVAVLFAAVLAWSTARVTVGLLGVRPVAGPTAP